MTCIVGIATAGKVHLAGDSAAVADNALTVIVEPKVFHNGPYVFGFTDSFRVGQLLRHAFRPPAPTGDLDRFLVTKFIDALRGCLQDGGVASRANEVEAGGTFLVGVSGRLFQVESDYQVGEAVDGFDAIGCASDVARGALFATPKLAPKARLRLALEAAERHSAGVRGPWTFITGGEA